MILGEVVDWTNFRERPLQSDHSVQFGSCSFQGISISSAATATHRHHLECSTHSHNLVNLKRHAMACGHCGFVLLDAICKDLLREASGLPDITAFFMVKN